MGDKRPKNRLGTKKAILGTLSPMFLGRGQSLFRLNFSLGRRLGQDLPPEKPDFGKSDGRYDPLDSL